MRGSAKRTCFVTLPWVATLPASRAERRRGAAVAAACAPYMVRCDSLTPRQVDPSGVVILFATSSPAIRLMTGHSKLVSTKAMIESPTARRSSL